MAWRRTPFEKENSMDRREFLKMAAVAAVGVLVGAEAPLIRAGDRPANGAAANVGGGGSGDGKASTVFMTEDISPRGLMAAYKSLGRTVHGKVAAKLSMGEPGGHYYLAPPLIKELVQSVDGVFVDCNTAYGGPRGYAGGHLKAARDHGFEAVAPIDLLDSEGEMFLPVRNGKHLKENGVGAGLKKYDSVLTLSHFKGHVSGGFGGAIKNIGIGFATPPAKCLIHSAGRSRVWVARGLASQEDFLESMAESASTIAQYMGDRIVYINVMNNLSIDCDCDSNPAPPEMPDIGILASLDPVALDQACVDLVYKADPKKSAALRERIESRKGLHTLGYAERLGMGSRRYELVRI